MFSEQNYVRLMTALYWVFTIGSKLLLYGTPVLIAIHWWVTR